MPDEYLVADPPPAHVGAKRRGPDRLAFVARNV